MVFPPQVVGPICTEVHREPIMRGDGMTTNRFATTCAICGGALAAGEGDVVINDGGSRRVVHPWCQPALAGGDARVEPVIVHRVLDAHDLGLPPAPRARRHIGAVVATALAGIGGMVLVVTGDGRDPSNTRTTGTEGVPSESAGTAIATAEPVAVAGATETRVTVYLAGANTPTPFVTIQAN